MARRRSQRPRRSGLAGFWLFLLGALVGAGLLYFACGDVPSRKSRDGGAPAAPPGRAAPPEASRSSRHAEATPPVAVPDTEKKPEQSAVPGETPPPAPDHPARVALVIDDLGRSVDELTPLEKLGVPITYAVLPFEENTPAVVSQLRGRREEILLHLPMQPKHGENPGPGALLVGMSDEQLRERTVAALQAVPGAVGVNNHMGSSLSADPHAMSTVLKVLSARNLFFLDSRTSPDSVGYRTAVSLGVPAAERQVFLDPDPRPEAVEEQFRRLLDLARTRGAAVAIGHPHPDTLAVLTAVVPRARAEGYDFVPVSYLLDRSAGQE
jgi:polysaccharide deacetylase 2 family uncharacterized protein YibQ